MKKLIKQIQENLTPDLLKPEYRKINENNPMYGHCYVATEVLYHLQGKEEGFFPHHGKDKNGVTHWWLQNEVGMIVDPTSDQYTSIGGTPPYQQGRRGAFLTKDPSKRAQIVIKRINLVDML